MKNKSHPEKRLNLAQRRELAKQALQHGFVDRGSFVAIPLRFPGVSTGIPADCSYVASLCGACGDHPWFFGTTRGDASHLFFAAPGAPYGYVLDLGVPPGMETIAAVAVWEGPPFLETVLVGGNSGRDGVVCSTKAFFPKDGIQEWGFKRREFIEVCRMHDNRLTGLTVTTSGTGQPLVVCLTERGLVGLDPESGKEVLRSATDFRAGIPGVIRTGNHIAVTDCEGRFWRVQTESQGLLESTAARMPTQVLASATWTAESADSVILGDGEGRLYRVDLLKETVQELPPAPLAPVACLAALPDGRLYGFCGDGIGRLFLWDGKSGTSEDLGAVAAVLGERRYAYSLSSALVGKNGEIYFGEHDRDGHLWIFFPPAV